MNDRIMVKARASEHFICFRTVSRARKSPHWFYIGRRKLAELAENPFVIVNDLGSFAVLQHGMQAGTLEIRFTWLHGSDSNISGYEETVTLPYDQLTAFVQDSAREDGPLEWKTLSLDPAVRKPRYVFHARETLRAVLHNDTARRKLVRFLRDGFNWPGAEQIRLYNDFVPYSFFFREIRDGKAVMCGGLILHGQEDMSKAYYSVHT